MELFFLILLIAIMAGALCSGFPVAFALPGAAILSIGLAALTGWLLAGNVDAYFVYDGPSQWLSAGVTNFRSLYWLVERDTLIAIPLFIFMGVVLQRSKIAEDLLLSMARLFGPIPGGIGLSVVVVGALLAATTGIVGATVVAMGLISLPSMMKNNYSKSLATGTICAAGSLGQIIPPSIVLIILADQLSNASDRANTIRKEMYTEATGESFMPSSLDVVSASAGDMFMGALIPGLILVGLYMLYIICIAIFKPEQAPAMKDQSAIEWRKLFLALLPPLTLIICVLGSILTGVATVNQAGAIGAVGAIIMAGYRLFPEGKKYRFLPLIISIISILVLAFLTQRFDLNIKSIDSANEQMAIYIALVMSAMLFTCLLVSVRRIYKHENTLREVMVETSKTTSMVFIILIGAAMLTSAFRAFGGEDIVRDFLSSLPGGFWTQFFVVMLIIFILGFFLDFIEIAVVVVPIVAPILLADPGANISAIWLGVMIGMNIQTSFLTPPFGFALFYLRGAAPKEIKTTDIYKGASIFIVLQLVGLSIAGFFPSLVNYLPNKTYLSSENSPPPVNPRLQYCLQGYAFEQYDAHSQVIEKAILTVQQLNLSVLPKDIALSMQSGFAKANQALSQSDVIRVKQAEIDDYLESYKPLQSQVMNIQRKIRFEKRQREELETELRRLPNGSEDSERAQQLQAEIKYFSDDIELELAKIPDNWEAARAEYQALAESLSALENQYRVLVDNAYEPVLKTLALLNASDSLANITDKVAPLNEWVFSSGYSNDEEKEIIIDKIKAIESEISNVEGLNEVRSLVAKGRREFDKQPDNINEIKRYFNDALVTLNNEQEWRAQAQPLLPEMQKYNEAIKTTIGLRLQQRLNETQASYVAACLAQHRDISTEF